MSDDQENLLNTDVIDGGTEVKECYAAFRGSEVVAANLKKLTEGLKGIPEAAEMLALANAIKFDYGRMLSMTLAHVKSKSKNSALAVIKKHWRLYEKNPSNELLFVLNKHLEISQTELALLCGISQAAVNARIERYKESLLPSDIDPNTADDDEKAEIVMKKLYTVASSNKIDRESINAAKVFLELYNKKIERTTVEKWKQVEILAEFFFSRLVPAVHQALIKAGVKLDVRAICLTLFEGVSQEVRDVLSKTKLPESDRKKGRPKKQ